MATPAELMALTWEAGRLGEAVEALATAAGFGSGLEHVPAPPGEVQAGGFSAVDRWLGAVAVSLGLEIEALESTYDELEPLLVRSAPLVVQMPGSPPRFLIVVRGRGRTLRVLDPGLDQHRIDMADLRAALCQDIEQTTASEAEQLLAEAGVSPRRRRRAVEALVRERLDPLRFGGFWALRLPPEASFWTQLRQAGAVRRMSIVLGAHLTQYLMMLGAWWLIGKGALAGRLDTGWLLGWLLLLLSTIPFQVQAFWHQGLFLIAAGGLLKQRLLAGVLRLEPEEVRTMGAGQVLGRVVEAEAVEQLLLSGGYLSLLAVPEVVLTMLVLSLGVGGRLHALLFLLWTLVGLGVAWLLYTTRDTWTSTRLEMTHDLVERMVGHRTRLAQQRPGHWHDGEDELLHAYLQASKRLDVLGPVFAAVAPGWRVIGILGLAAAFISGAGTPAGLAVGLGGVLLGARALTRISDGVASLVGAAIAWKRVGPMFRAATRPRQLGSLEAATAVVPEHSEAPLIDARELTYAYPGRSRQVLDSIRLAIAPAEHVLLTGPSGGGKSTLAALLTGVRTPSAGIMLLGGLDMETLGAASWRSRVVAAPQFHENHVLTETLAFNLLMGRAWPASTADLSEAEAICRELGLGPLLDRMPAGLMQMVGDTGWQLSHGERSRLFMARALLQHADLVILDESFGALDPHNLADALACARRHARSLLVIAHP